MKSLSVITATLLAVSTPSLASDIGVSVTIGQPGFYGHIDLGDFHAPALVYRQPVVIYPGYGGWAPAYLRVPSGHYRNWDKHCGRYNACGRPVYFVRDSWYNDVYAPRYLQHHGYDRPAYVYSQRQYHGHGKHGNERDHRGDRGDRDDRHSRGHWSGRGGEGHR